MLNRIKKAVLAASLGILLFPVVTSAATTVTVKPNDTQGWASSPPPLADTRPGGAVNFIPDSTAPAGVGALQLTTDATTTSKAQYMHVAGVPLSTVNELSYYTKQNSASFPGGVPSYQLVVCLTGAPDAVTCNGFTTLVYEPYQNGTVIPNTWQQWDVDAGQFWSSRSFTEGACTVTAGGGGAPFYTLAALKTACPNAVVAAYGVNIGSNNPSYDVETDLFNFNGTIYDFEPNVAPPTTKDQCKNNGYKQFNNPAFKNQGQCIAYVNSHGSPEEVEGTLRLSGPSQKVEFDVDDDEGNDDDGTVEYWNYEYPGGLHYEANVLCVGGDKSLKEARVMFQVPEGHPGISGLYIVSYVKESSERGVKNLYGHAATADFATATTWCETGAGYTPTMYEVTRGDVEVE